MTTINAYQKNLWTTYISTLLRESEIKLNKPFSDPSNEKIDLNLRPFLLSPSQRKYNPLASLQAANKRLKRTNEMACQAVVLLNWHMQLHKIDHLFTQVSINIVNLVSQISLIDNNQVRQANNQVRLVGLSLLGSAVLIIGAVTHIPWVKTAGEIVIVTSWFFYGIKLLWTFSYSEKAIKDYGNIQQLCTHILTILSCYDEEMKLPPSPPQNYPFLTEIPYPSTKDLNKVIYEKFS